MDQMIGKRLANRYEILEKIGEGGMATVYKAKCHLLSRFVAIKVLKEEFVNDEEFNIKFKNEAMAAGGLNQQNIIAVYDVGEEDGYPYIVMEYVDGGNIKDIIHRQGKLPVEEAINYTRQIALALKEAHQNKIVHRDIKPQNLMIGKNNMIKVADFGIAKAVTSSTITAVGTIMGSVHYFSPEQARGGYIDARSDIYSLGIVMYEMVTGKLPFDGDSPVNIALKHLQEEIRFDDNDDIPTELKEIIRKATQKSPDRRYKTVEALLDDLDYIQNSKMLALGMGFEDETYRTQVIHVDQDDEYQKILFNDVARAREDIKPKRRKRVAASDHRQEVSEPIKKSSVALVALGALIAALIFSGILFAINRDFLGGKEAKFETPSFVGMTLEEAAKEAQNYNVTVEESAREKNVNFAAGEITRQEPTQGTKISKGTIIYVTVAADELDQLVKVPELVGKMIDEGTKELEALGLKPILEYRQDAEQQNKIIAQLPVEGYELERGANVKLTVSSGLDESEVEVPSVVGSDAATAKRQLDQVKLGHSISYREDKSKPEGVVLSQNPSAGTKVQVDSEVSIVLNRYEKASVSRVPIIIRLEEDRSAVRVEVVDMDSGNVVYNQTVNPVDLGGTLTVTVEGEPGQVRQYHVYLDGDRTSIYASPRVEF